MSILSHTVEITEEAFKLLTVGCEFGDSVTEHTEQAIFRFYSVYDTQLITIYNHVSMVEQYYVKDINA